MSIRDGYNSKKVVTFDMQDRLDNKIDKLTCMMSKLTARVYKQNKPFKPKIYQGKRRGQTRNYYDQGNYQNGYRSNSGDRRMPYRGRAQYGQNIEEGPNMLTIIGKTSGKEILEECKIIEVKILKVDIAVTMEMTTLEEVGDGQEKDDV